MKDVTKRTDLQIRDVIIKNDQPPMKVALKKGSSRRKSKDSSFSSVPNSSISSNMRELKKMIN